MKGLELLKERCIKSCIRPFDEKCGDCVFKIIEEELKAKEKQDKVLDIIKRNCDKVVILHDKTIFIKGEIKEDFDLVMEVLNK